MKLNEVFKLSYLPELIERKIHGTEKGILPGADLEFYRREYERLVNDLEIAAEKTTIPEKQTAKDDLNELLIRLRLNNSCD